MIQVKTLKSDSPTGLEKEIGKFLTGKGIKEADLVGREDFQIPDVLLSFAAGLRGLSFPVQYHTILTYQAP